MAGPLFFSRLYLVGSFLLNLTTINLKNLRLIWKIGRMVDKNNLGFRKMFQF